MRRVLFLLAVFSVAAFTAKAQDPVKVDPKHYKVEFENAQVRVLRIQYGPHDKSVMHDHPDRVGVILTEEHVRVTFPDGKTEEHTNKPGDALWGAKGKHLPENLGDKPFEVILVELKAKSAAAKAPAAKKKS